MRTTACIAVALSLGWTSGAFSQKIDIPIEMQEEFSRIAMMVAVADQCNKRFDEPQIYRDATAVLAQFFCRANVDRAEERAAELTEMIASQPIDRVEPAIGFIINENSCGNLTRSLDEQLGN